MLSKRTAHHPFRPLDDYVGVVLRADGGRVDLVVSAIRDDNTGAHLVVVDHGTAVEIRTTAKLRVTAETLRWHMGGHFGTSDLQSMILSSLGRVTTDAKVLAVTSDRLS